jgi:Skp family chaperone for outer membrane proteins
MTQTIAPPTVTATTPSPKKAWWKRTWVLVVAALLVGVGIGSSSNSAPDPKSSVEYKAAASDLRDTKSQLASTQGELTKAQGDLKTIAGDLPQREAALKDAQAQLKQDQASLKKDRADLKARDASVTAREKKVGIVEKTIAANTVSGDGVYKVGADIKAGTYKTPGRGDCYYAVLNSSDTMDIATNNNVSGPAYVTVHAGQYFESSGCADWVLTQ